MFEKIIVAVASAASGALAGATLTYTLKAVQLEGRIDGIERSIQRIESRLFPNTKGDL